LLAKWAWGAGRGVITARAVSFGYIQWIGDLVLFFSSGGLTRRQGDNALRIPVKSRRFHDPFLFQYEQGGIRRLCLLLAPLNLLISVGWQPVSIRRLKPEFLARR
jgi:hypothetical protein